MPASDVFVYPCAVSMLLQMSKMDMIEMVSNRWNNKRKRHLSRNIVCEYRSERCFIADCKIIFQHHVCDLRFTFNLFFHVP